MIRCLWAILAAYLIPALIVVVLLLASPGLRQVSFRAASELPGVATYFLVRKSVVSRDFSAAAGWLQWQLDISNRVGQGQTTILPSLSQNAAYVIDRARYRSEYEALLPFVRALSDKHANLHLFKSWLSRILLEVDPKQVFEVAEQAAKLIPADERPYRHAVQAAIKIGQPGQAQAWCGRYRSAQFGGVHPHEYNPLFAGLDIRKMALEVKIGDKPVFVGNEGVTLGGPRTYSFELPETLDASAFRLHLAAPDSVWVDVEWIEIYRADGKQRLKTEAFWLMPSHGYFDQRNHIGLQGKDGETISFSVKDQAQAGGLLANRIDIRMRFGRRGFLDIPACTGLLEQGGTQ